MLRPIVAVVVAAFTAFPLLAAKGMIDTTTNPLLADWKTPFGVPPFDQIENEHFRAAFDAAIEEQKKDLASIAGSTEPPTFANTVEALERSGALLGKVSPVFFNLNSAETNLELQAIAKEVAPRLAALRDDIYLDDGLFRRVETVWQSRGDLSLDAEQERLLEETRKDFVRSGAKLDAEAKARLREINGELSVLSVTFGENLLAETNAYRLVIENEANLAGLPERVVAAAAAAAKQDGLEGKRVFTLHWPSISAFLDNARNRELRRQIMEAYLSRGANGNEHDNRAILVKIAALRSERAQLLGYPTHAHYVLEENMAKTPERVRGLMDQLWAPALAKAKEEAQALQERIEAEGGTFALAPWDWRYYTERLRQERYAIDEQETRQYFPLESVLGGAFELAHRLYGLSFVEREDLPVYHSEVRAFEVLDGEGAHLGVFYADYFPRPGKRGGAWKSSYRTQHREDGRDVRPVVVNVANFSRPAGEAPALLSIEEVETLFHEFGHALHSLLSRIHYESLAGTPRDFVELPSQIMENWVLEPEMLQLYARHWQTDEVIPADLVERLRAARLFNGGFASVEYLAAAYLDMDWHTLEAAPEVDADTFETRSMERIGLIAEIPPRYHSSYFSHIFSGGYSAGYYSYDWCEVLEADAFQAFQEHGIFDRATAQSFRTNILERGGTADAMELWKAFRGREPRVDALLIRRGFAAAESVSR